MMKKAIIGVVGSGAISIKESLNNSTENLPFSWKAPNGNKSVFIPILLRPKLGICSDLRRLGRSYPATANKAPRAWYRFAKAISENTCAAFLAIPL